MTGALEEAAKATGGFIEAMRQSPLALANLVLNIAFLVFLFYYVSRISSRAEGTVAALFAAQDKLYAQWGVIIKDQVTLTEKTMHCILPEDAIKLLQLSPRATLPPVRPQGGDMYKDPPKPHPTDASVAPGEPSPPDPAPAEGTLPGGDAAPR